ncbi:MAG: hypothetical protein JXB36_06350 [Gammaproteobacteria bacterium]|nr:hypothetical protein [Gammaproteobacteria bacterium]
MRALCLPLVIAPALACSAPKPPPALCAKEAGDAECVAQEAPEPPTGAVKWHPGHYMQMMLGESTRAQQPLRFGWYDEIGRNRAIAGVTLRVKWGELEGDEGEYRFDTLRRELDKLRSLPSPKQLFIRVHDRTYGNGGGCESDMYPPYLRNGNGCAATANGSIARIWDPAVADRLIALYRALAEAFDADPAFEGIMLIRETATSGKVSDSSYSHSAYKNQLKRLVEAASEAFARSNVVLPVNYLGGQENVDELIAHAAEVGAGQGGPDVLPDGLANQRPLAYNTLDGSSTGIEYRKRMPVLYSIESSQLGGSLCERCQPRDLHRYAENELNASHLFWSRNTWAGSASQQWESGILPWINENPLRNTSCPPGYEACSK